MFNGVYKLEIVDILIKCKFIITLSELQVIENGSIAINDGIIAAVGKDDDISKKFPFKDSSFDVITSSLVFDHLEDLKSLFKECNRVLKNKGIKRCSSCKEGRLSLIHI